MPHVSTTAERVFRLEEATVADIQAAMQAGVLTSVELTMLYLNRIYYYDRNGIRLNSIPIINPEALQEAEEADRLRKKGIILGPLHGIPFTVKDSYMVKGMTVASGSPAFANLVAGADCFTVEKLREAGGVLLGKTNMPPMAAGGMQKGLYGRAESPYNADYLPAAWFSGSSNGSGASTAANFAVFGMAEETVSSGRSPASNNGLCAYTPSRGVISIRGNWPLFPVRDVVVPHTRTVEDMLAVLEVIVAEDPVAEGDFWREQQAVTLPAAGDVRPASYLALKDPAALQGKRIGVPRMYIGQDRESEQPIAIRPSIAKLWERAARELEQLGAEVVEVDVPLFREYEADPVFLKPMEEKGYLPEGWMVQEWEYLNAYAAEAFLQSIGDADYPTWKDVDPETVFPNPPGSVDEQRGHNNARYAQTIAAIRQGVRPIEELPGFSEALRGLEMIRKTEFEDWLAASNLDLLAFPANCNIGRSDTDMNEASYAEAWENGNYFSNTNYVLRHLGIPSVSLCMGIMEDTAMPVNITLIGPAYSDNELLRYAFAYEQATRHRRPAPRTPALADESFTYSVHPSSPGKQAMCGTAPEFTLRARISGSKLMVEGLAHTLVGVAEIRVYVNGRKYNAELEGGHWQSAIPLAPLLLPAAMPTDTLAILAICKDQAGHPSVCKQELRLPFSAG